MEEVWKDIEGYEGLYQVSNLGRVKSLEKIVLNKGSKILKPEIILKTGFSRDGYPLTTISKNNKTRTFRINRLVAQAFIPNPENKDTVNHKNGIKTDNRVENLEWNTRSENVLHAYKYGLKISVKGEKHYASKITEKDALDIKYNKGLSAKDAAKTYGITLSMVFQIRRGVKWKHI